ncbi:hypothetical protein NQZ68_001125 [Dissostichus eleginoides]|nr:hypothetical protein NQZ68_001125 [Dissostichus eleginoides]
MSFTEDVLCCTSLLELTHREEEVRSSRVLVAVVRGRFAFLTPIFGSNEVNEKHSSEVLNSVKSLHMAKAGRKDVL